MSQVVGGDFWVKVKVRSGWIVIWTGVGVPGVMCAVRATNEGTKEGRREGEGE